MRHNFTYQYQNILLRPLGKDDIEKLRIWRNNDKNVKYLTKIPFITCSIQKSWFDSYLDDSKTITFAIVELNHIKNIVGSISIYNIEKENAELGKLLVGDEDAHGLHVGENSLKAVIYIAYHELHIKNLYLHVYKNNVKAVHLYKKVGFLISDEYLDESDKIEYLMNYKANYYLNLY